MLKLAQRTQHVPGLRAAARVAVFVVQAAAVALFGVSVAVLAMLALAVLG